MLLNIVIKNYALIEALNIDLDPGLNVITGETGAGKSIVIDALTLLLGQRGNKSNIRHGADKMVVQGLFDIDGNQAVAAKLAEFGIEPEDGRLILTREIDTKGKNVCRADGMIITVTQLRAIGDNLIDIHGQHEHQSLFQRENHRHLLDDFGGDPARELLGTVAEDAARLKELSQKIRGLEKDEREMERQKEMFLYELKEIRAAKLIDGEEESLESDKKILVNSEQLFRSANEAYRVLNGDENAYQTALLALLTELGDRIRDISEIDSGFKAYEAVVESAYQELENLSFEIRSYIDGIDFDMNNLDEVEKRLGVITGLKRKYGSSIKEILDYGTILEERLSGLMNRDEQIEKFQKQYKKILRDYESRTTALHEMRKKAGQVFKEALERELKDLAMEKTVVQVQISQEKKLISPKGQDQVEFLISVNPGVPPKPLRKIASGGEISRIMLGIKSIFGDRDRIQTMIFDEIDTGISGRTAQAVAEKVFELSKTHQIICITHLPQIASMADKHFLVEKKSDDDGVEVNFGPLGEQERQNELARMLSGAEVTQTTLDHAAEMLEMTKKLKKTK
ncbi:DNA repair protein RecN [Eubacterium callanderi]|uniref:DNA repair protein RecN n=1 Tax=Eubacterium callanderi TaxID=53442 RepID=UPI001C109F53|nr:DNA repair protein RecN [Eubacterium callanderi]MBU5305839.1 DNA repair protein RecN [Eubacterium callanderi]